MIQSLDISKTTLGIAAGVAGTLFIGYCIYFDQKRIKDPEYKKKVKERRLRQKKAAMASSHSEKPDLTNPESVQRYLLQEIQLGEEYISSGDVEQGVEHLANAVIVCGQPAQLLQVLQQTLPAQVFMLLITKMKEFSSQKSSEPEPPKATLTESIDDDLE